MKNVLTIAGSDPSGGAGIQADLRTINTFSLNGLSAITAVTAQGHKGVKDLLAIPTHFVISQLKVLIDSYRIDAVKIGMLANEGTVLALARLLQRAPFEKIVLDPILVSSNNFPLMEKEGISAIKCLFPLVSLVTPNIYEASVLAEMKIRTEEDMANAAKKINAMGAVYVLVKGGHLSGHEAVDILYDGRDFKRFKSRRIDKTLHGTGCAFSTVIALHLAKGEKIDEAVRKAKEYVRKHIARHGVITRVQGSKVHGSKLASDEERKAANHEP